MGGEGSALGMHPALHLVCLTSMLEAYTARIWLGEDAGIRFWTTISRPVFCHCLAGFVHFIVWVSSFSFLIFSFTSISIVPNCYDILIHMLHTALDLYL